MLAFSKVLKILFRNRMLYPLLVGLLLFQNCSRVHFQSTQNSPTTNGNGGTSNPPVAPKCIFNGKEYTENQTVVAYRTSSVPANQECEKETRVCKNGTFTGSFMFVTCSKGVFASCLFNGVTVPHMGEVRAYQNSSVPYGESCKDEVRICLNGTLTGSYAFNSCDVAKPAACLFNGQTIPSGESVVSYQNSSVPFGSSCSMETRSCFNGVLSGTFNYASCEVSKPQSCLFNGQTIVSGQSVTAFLNSSVRYGESCQTQTQTRTCDNGSLSGSFNYASCQEEQPASCLFDGRTLAHGENVQAFQSSTVPFGGSCAVQTRSCSNGQLSGSFGFSSCSVSAPAACNFNGRNLAHGESVAAYGSSSVPFGYSCTSESRVCNNGSLSGSFSFASCQTDGPASCLFAGRNLAHGESVAAYTSSGVPFGQQCQGEVRTCYNGNLNGSFAHISCAVAPPQSCTVNMIDAFQGSVAIEEAPVVVTLAHGQSITAYSTASRIGSCAGLSRTCNNGVLSGNPNAIYRSCVVTERPGSPLMIHWNSQTEWVESLVFTSQKDGINFDLLGRNSRPVPFAPKRISWYRSSQYYFLTLPNSEGEVKGIDQLFGDNTFGPDSQFAADGYKALAKYDGTTPDGRKQVAPADGLITPADPIYYHLRAWNDRNFDGIAQSQELKSLEEMGIELIDLNADPNFKEVDRYGNETTLKSVVRSRDGRLHLMFDIWFQYFEINEIFKGDR